MSSARGRTSATRTGKTRDVGYQIGVRRTMPLALDEAWALLTSPEGVRLWLGDAPGVEIEPGADYVLEDGSSGEIRVVSDRSHLRLTWQPGDWPRASTLQVRVIPKDERTTIAFHQEHLPGPDEREARRAHFARVLDAIGERLRES